MEFQFYIVSPMFCVWATRSLFHDARQRKYRGWIVFAALLLISILVRTLMLMIADPNFEATIAIPPEYPHIAAAQPASFTLFYSKVGGFSSCGSHAILPSPLLPDVCQVRPLHCRNAGGIPLPL